MLSVRKTRLARVHPPPDKRALAVKSLRDNPERFLATVQICITTVGTAAAAFGGARLEHDMLEPSIQLDRPRRGDRARGRRSS